MAKKSDLSKIYREFTRIKFQKYRLQYPKVRESELISKILKEWEAMDEESKFNMGKEFVERTGKGFLEDPSSSSKKGKKPQKKSEPMSSSARESGSKKITKKKKISPKVRVFVQKSTPKDLLEEYPDFKKEKENSKSPGKQSTPEKKSGSSSELAVEAAKRGGKVPEGKKLSPRAQQYMSFFKYYHDRLTQEHPRWSTAQIATIIKLLWRKRHTNPKKKRREIAGKTLTGRQLYNRTKLSEGLLREQIKQLWRALPFESKRYWHIKGQGRPHRSKRDSGKYVRRVLNQGASREASKEEGGLEWMNQQMK